MKLPERFGEIKENAVGHDATTHRQSEMIERCHACVVMLSIDSELCKWDRKRKVGNFVAQRSDPREVFPAFFGRFHPPAIKIQDDQQKWERGSRRFRQKRESVKTDAKRAFVRPEIKIDAEEEEKSRKNVASFR